MDQYLSIKRGQTSVILRVKIRDTSDNNGAGKTGLAFNTANNIISVIASNGATPIASYTTAGSTIEDITTLGTYAAPTATKCRFKEVDATNHPGLYEIQFADSIFATASARHLTVTIVGASDAEQTDLQIQLTSTDNPVASDVVMLSGDSTAADNLETAFDDTAGSVPWTNIIDQGTAQSVTGTTIVLRAAAAFANDELIGCLVYIVSATTGAGQCRQIRDYVSSTDTATVDTWTVTPTGTIVYHILPAAGSATGLDVNVVSISGDATAADNLELAYDGTGYGTILQGGTLTVAGAQTAPVLSAGSADNDAYIGCLLVITDQSTAAQKAVVPITDYVGSSKTVTLANAPCFTIATGDLFTILPLSVAAALDGTVVTASGSTFQGTLTLNTP